MYMIIMRTLHVVSTIILTVENFSRLGVLWLIDQSLVTDKFYPSWFVVQIGQSIPVFFAKMTMSLGSNLPLSEFSAIATVYDN